MAWKETYNGEPDSLSIKNSGKCELCGKLAEVTTFLGGTVVCKTDLQKTYHVKGYKCSLQEDNEFPNSACMDICSLIQK